LLRVFLKHVYLHTTHTVPRRQLVYHPLMLANPRISNSSCGRSSTRPTAVSAVQLHALLERSVLSEAVDRDKVAPVLERGPNKSFPLQQAQNLDMRACQHSHETIMR
jgi:hypothetical protein